jgi:hypothetical protein
MGRRVIVLCHNKYYSIVPSEATEELLVYYDIRDIIALWEKKGYMTLIMSQYNDPCDLILPLMSQYNNASKYHNPILFLISQYNNGSSVASDGTIANYLLCTNNQISNYREETIHILEHVLLLLISSCTI